MFIFVPDCTEAYIVVEKTLTVRAAFSSDGPGLRLPAGALKEGGLGLFIKPYIFQIIGRLLKVLHLDAV